MLMSTSTKKNVSSNSFNSRYGKPTLKKIHKPLTYTVKPDGKVKILATLPTNPTQGENQTVQETRVFI